MVAYYPHNIVAWMDGTEGLDDGEYRAYHVICQLIYLNDGPIVMHESGIAGRCNQHVLSFRKNLQKLIAKGKVAVAADGKIMNARAKTELEKIASRRRNPSRTSSEPRGGSAEVAKGSGWGSPPKPLKNMATPIPDDAPNNSIVEKKETIAAKAAMAPKPDGDLDARTVLFRRGLTVLAQITGKPPDRCRSLIGKWLREADDDAVAVMRVLEDAERNRPADPMSWITRSLDHRRSGRRNGRSGNGMADLVLNLRSNEDVDGDDDGARGEGPLSADGDDRVVGLPAAARDRRAR